MTGDRHSNGPGQRLARRLVAALPALFLTLQLAACGDSSSLPPVLAADPAAPGSYPVGVTRVILFDAARGRTLQTEVWYPADESARGLPPATAQSYLPPELGFLADDATIPLVAVRDVPIAPGGPFPLVAFSHGSGGIRFQNPFQCEHLASHGFVVAAPDHQGNTYFDGGESIPALRIDRPLDIRFLFDEMTRLTADPSSPFHDWIDVSRPFGVTGHSFGAYTSVEVANQDPRVAASLPMALTGVIGPDYSAATLLLFATEDKTIGEDANQEIRNTYDVLPGPRFLGEFPDGGHYSFSFACYLGLGIGDRDGCGEGKRFADGSTFTFVESTLVWDAVDTYSVALFGRYLKGIREYDSVLATNVAPEIMDWRADLR
ncbi:MAG: alpha/beta hydrolase family protein [Alphaproteobacteria bacterium]